MRLGSALILLMIGYILSGRRNKVGIGEGYKQANT